MMQALKKLSLCFASVLAFAFAGTAEAKRAEYEINGTTYTYNTRSRVQVEVARRRIKAANRVAEVKARAAAEVTNNPFVRLFGSRTQAEVPGAKSELQRLLAGPEPSRAEARAVERQVRQEIRTERRRIALESRAKKREQVARRSQPSPRVIATVRDNRAANAGSGLTGSISEEAVERETYMMGFVEQLRGKPANDPISRRLREQ